MVASSSIHGGGLPLATRGTDSALAKERMELLHLVADRVVRERRVDINHPTCRVLTRPVALDSTHLR